jgi:hypothetical protein
LGSKSEKHLNLFSNIFLLTRGRYKPVAKKVHPVIGKLPDKSQIVHKFIGNPLESMPKLNPNPPSIFEPTDWYTLEQQDQINKNHPGGFLWPAKKDLMHDFIKSCDIGFAWTEGVRVTLLT